VLSPWQGFITGENENRRGCRERGGAVGSERSCDRCCTTASLRTLALPVSWPVLILLCRAGRRATYPDACGKLTISVVDKRQSLAHTHAKQASVQGSSRHLVSQLWPIWVKRPYGLYPVSAITLPRGAGDASTCPGPGRTPSLASHTTRPDDDLRDVACRDWLRAV